VSFIVTQQKSLFPESVVADWSTKLADNQELTDNFLKPFQQIALFEETTTESGSKITPWMINGFYIFSVLLFFKIKLIN
jgi:hypothetical protein